MKRGSLIILLLTILLPITLVSAQNIYQQDSLELELEVKGSLELTSSSSSAKITQVSAELLLFPQESFRQKILNIDTTGEKLEKSIDFNWQNPSLGEKEFGYTAKVKTLNDRNKVKLKIPFPLTDIKGYEQYTLPSTKIDSNHPTIKAKAAELVEGEDDLFKAVFNLASWVSQNVEYDLNELTTNTAQKASWVLENRQGVCDEMTSLFVAMARSQGIPAKFVSGISYTENPEVLEALGENWAGHGWAEVYFPTVGWVNFDIAFDEFGYIDVSHIKLREGLDPDEPATKFEWLADNVELSSKGLQLNANILDRGNFVPEHISLEEEILAKEVDYGSYNLIKAIVKNNENFYAVTTLKLAAPTEVEIIGENKRQILLKPKEVRETYWIVKVSESLQDDYWYQFPMLIYSEKNITVEEEFKAQKGKALFSKKEIEELTVTDEEKSYSRKITFDCDYLDQVKPNIENIFSCKVKNIGDQNLQGLSFCLDNVCEKIDLPSNQEKIQEIKVIESEPGWHHIIVSIENDDVEKKISLPFTVVDSSEITIEINAPKELILGEEVPITIKLNKNSFNPPKKVVIKLRGLGVEQKWELEELPATQELKTNFPGKRIGFKNKILVSVDWEDQQENFHLEEKIERNGKGISILDNLTMILNTILNLLS
ncbi:MAG: transglutaminase-like domain-containing protein [Candidatus Woesearchaeota archaeon]